MFRLASRLNAVRKFASDNSPAILTAVAVVGVVSTAILAAKAAPQANIDILNQESESTEELDLADKVFLTYQYYVPAAIMGAATIACIIGANTISTRRSAALASAYGLAELAMKDYRDKVVEQIGANKEEKIHDDVMKDIVDRNPVSSSQVIIAGAGRSLFLDNFSLRYFETDMETVRRAVNDVNSQIINEMYASMNDFYRRIGLDSSTVGEEVGWTTDKLLEVRYSTQLTDDGRPCVVLDYVKKPIRDYHKFG